MERSSKARTFGEAEFDGARVRGRVGWRGARPSPAAFAAGGRACPRPPASGGLSLRHQTKPMVVAIAFVCAPRSARWGTRTGYGSRPSRSRTALVAVPGPVPRPSLGATVPVGTARACHRDGMAAANIRAGIGGSGKVSAFPGVTPQWGAAVGLGSLGPPAPPLPLRPLRLWRIGFAQPSLRRTAMSSRHTRSRRCRRP